MKTILTCFFLLYPHQGEGYNTSIIRLDKRTPEKCEAAVKKWNGKSTKNQCKCEVKKKGGKK